MKHHKVERNVSRGYFLDRRYPHFTAVVSDPAGVRWVVDSWYKPMGGAPDIMLLEQWKLRGQFDSEPLDETFTPVPKRQHPPGEEVRRVCFVVSNREEVATDPIRQFPGGGGYGEISFAV